MTVSLYKEWSELRTEDIDTLWITIRPPKMPVEFSHISIGLLYHPPNAQHREMTNHINGAMDYIRRRHPYTGFLIMGDFNQLPDGFLRTKNHLKQIVKSPTRKTAILDKLFTNMKWLYSDTEVVAPVGTADHNVVLCQPQLPRDHDFGKPKYVKRCVMGQNEKAIFAMNLKAVRWESLYHMESCEHQFNVFQDSL